MWGGYEKELITYRSKRNFDSVSFCIIDLTNNNYFGKIFVDINVKKYPNAFCRANIRA